MGTPALDRTSLSRNFSMVAFDWDGTAVANHTADAAPAREAIERLLILGVIVVVITGTNRTHLDRQFADSIKPHLRHRLYLATNRGSEVFGYTASGEPVLLWGRKATPEEDKILSSIASEVKRRLEDSGKLQVGIVSDRLNRRKIDLVPTESWTNPPESPVGERLKKVEERLTLAGLQGGIQAVVGLAREVSMSLGLLDARITTDVKHVEVGLTDKSDSMTWLIRRLAWDHGISPREILIAGDEFGPIAGFPGSDFLMRTPETAESVFVSVGTEPHGVPDGVIHLGGGPERFLSLIREIAGRLERGETEALPQGPQEDPCWLVTENGYSPARELEVESILTVSNGYVGTRGTLFERGSALGPGTVVAGVFEVPPAPPGGKADGNPVPAWVVVPDWIRLRMESLESGNEEEGSGLTDGTALENKRTLDLRQGLFWRELRHRDSQNRVTSIKGFRLASQKDRHLLIQSLEIVPVNYSGRIRIEAESEIFQSQHKNSLNAYPQKAVVGHDPARNPGDPITLTLSYRGGSKIAFGSAGRLVLDDGTVVYPQVSRVHDRVVEYWELDVEMDRVYRFERLVSVQDHRDSPKPSQTAVEHLRKVKSQGIEACVQAHLAEWRRRWQVCNIEIDGDPQAQRALRFSAYHLLSCGNPEDERVSIGARALTGNSYLGHVFWDTEIFMVPFFIYSAPDIALSLLMYRYHTLPGARENAKRRGYEGALYAWESTDTGLETTPSSILSPTGERIRVLTGEQEHHITADVAYAVWQYYQATGDEDFISGPGLEILVETARFWASRAKLGDDGEYHIEQVIGPDEYHEGVRDSAFTNEMARWNLRCAMALVEREAAREDVVTDGHWQDVIARLGLRPGEEAKWAAIADRLARARVREGVIEQFAGYFDLENLTAKKENQPGGTDFRIFLDFEHLGKTQLIKQADVVMLLHLLEEELGPLSEGNVEEMRRRSFAYYEERTLHGSSLSPAIYALMAAKIGQVDLALRYFRMAAEIDLFNNMGNASGGIHAAAQGGLWQAAILGFAGLRVGREEVSFTPRLPSSWQNMRFHVMWRGQTLAVHLAPGIVEIACSGWAPVPVRIGHSEVVRLGPGESRRWTALTERDGAGSEQWICAEPLPGLRVAINDGVAGQERSASGIQ